jgi:para-aminobenzoate synthetase
MTDRLRVLLVGLWLDAPPAGALPARAAGLGAVAVDSGYALAVVPRAQLDVPAWLAVPPAGIILSGSGRNLGEDCTLADFPEVCSLLDALPQVPVLGICFGHQFLAVHAGGWLERMEQARRISDWPVRWTGAHAVSAGLPQPCAFCENHVQRVADPGRGFRVIATSDDGIEAMAHEALPRLGVQFHPEYFPEQVQPQGRNFLGNWFRSLRRA